MTSHKKRIMMNLCYCLVVYEFQSESTLYSLPEWQGTLFSKRCLIWSLSDSNEIWTHNHLVRERKLNHLAKLALTGWVLVYKLNDCRFESRCCHLNSDECLKMFRRKVSQWFCKFKFCEIFLNIFEDENGSEFTIVPGLTSPDKSSFNRVKKCKNNDL